MTVTGIITALVFGAIIGVAARLLLPGRQNISMLVTVIVGIVGAFLGTALAHVLGISTNTPGIDWGELACQVVVAIVGVALVSGLSHRGGRGRRPLTR